MSSPSDHTGRAKKAIEKALAATLEPHERALLLAACDTDAELADRTAPFHALLRRDLRGLPQVYLAGGVYVTKTLERRSSGTDYRPRCLVEEMVRQRARAARLQARGSAGPPFEQGEGVRLCCLGAPRLPSKRGIIRSRPSQWVEDWAGETSATSD